jgi:hypothetical protein
MKKIIFIALAATTAIAAAPASAQSGGYGGTGYGNVEVRADQLQMRLQAGVRSGAISRAEAMPLREQLRQLTRLEILYGRDGISGRERADLQHRINSLRQGIRMAERSGDSRYGRDDEDRYDRDDDRYSRGDRDVDSRYDRDRDGWDDRDGNRDGRWDVDSRYDSNLRVGQRVSGDLGPVPYAYRSLYRDSDNFYHRSDGRNIYQIDTRTQTVVRVNAMNR